ncbi:DUF2637 domain-containing protein [Streptomyces sp. NPDC097619]|uniref:DUF2637 domain-containing protein n=1 Tax=Streptomyces sp. NPDC097619 TaxID=3157228 RepID=UPI003326C895
MSRSVRLDAVLVQAVIAGALSFAHLHDLAEAAGQTGWKAWAYPVSVDLLLVAAWRRMRTDAGNRDAWLWFAIALVASLGANVATAGLLDMDSVPPWLRILVAGWPAIAFLGGTLLAHSQTPDPTPDVPAEPDPAPEPEVNLTVERAPDPVPELTPAPTRKEPEAEPPTPPFRPPASPTTASVPPALLDHARKIADSHRARTGTAIDAATLRSRLGVPAALADSIAVQLT